jgi:hypothetical protein
MWHALEDESTIVIRKPENMRPLWRPMHRWEVNIKMDLK